MALPTIVGREEWLAARKDLLVREKALTRERDALNADRRRLPMVEITKDYRFEGPDGQVSLLDLFGDKRQLAVEHVMFDPSWEDACPSCTATIDEIAPGTVEHLRSRETQFVLISRTPLDKIEAYRQRRGWSIPWYSSYGSDFNYDFHVTMDESVMPMEFNYRTNAEYVANGWADGLAKPGESSEQPGNSCFLRDGDRVFHTYSAYARGVEFATDTYALLDMTALGRQEDWEEPKGRSGTDRGAVPNFTD